MLDVTFTHAIGVMNEMFTCVICLAEFKRKGFLIKHEKKGHQRFKCQECGKDFTTNHHLQTHNENVHLRIRHVCKECGKDFSCQSHLSTHKKAVHEKLKWDCGNCEFRASSAGNLRRHQKNVHDGDKEECKICFKRLHNVAVHIKEVHEGYKYKCDQCNLIFSSNGGLRHHKMKIHAGIRYNCKDCDKSFKNNKSLKNHIKINHDDDGSRFQCPSCGLKFLLEMYLIRHTEKHHTIKEVKPFHTCDICGHKAKNKRSIQIHKLTIHDGVKYSCKDCSKDYTSKEMLKQHTDIVHLGKKAKYQERNKKIVLTRKEKGEVFRCEANENCQKSYESRSALSGHIQSIHTSKVFKCQECPQIFQLKSSLNRHSKNKHRQNLKEEASTKSKQFYDCDVCDIKICSKSELRDHFFEKHFITG